VGLTSLPSEAPLPVSATSNAAGTSFTVTFDAPLVPALLNPTNWRIRRANSNNPGISASATGSIVSGTASPGTPQFGPDRLFFDPPPFDLIGLNGLPVAAFDMPYTVV